MQVHSSFCQVERERGRGGEGGERSVVVLGFSGGTHAHQLGEWSVYVMDETQELSKIFSLDICLNLTFNIPEEEMKLSNESSFFSNTTDGNSW